MRKTVNQRELRNAAAQVLREVETGQSVVVTRNGEPVAELRPLEKRRFVPRAVLERAIADAARIDPQRFREDVDAVIDQSVDG